MRVSEAIPQGRNVLLYHPELFKEHEEVIVYDRDEFKRTYLSMHEYIDDIIKLYCCHDRDRYWELEALWSVIMERINMININKDLFYELKDAQSYLDTYVKIPVESPEDLYTDTATKVPTESLDVGWL